MNILSFFILCGAILPFIHANENEGESKHAALIFSRQTHQIVEVDKNDDQKICDACFSACPASTRDEENFNEKYSLTSSSLFFQKEYELDGVPSKMDVDICKSSFAPGMVYDNTEKSYKTGYEIYTDSNMYTLFKSGDFYCSLRKVINNEVDIAKKAFDSDAKIRRTGSRFVTLDRDPPLEWQFYWITVLSIRFSKHQVHIKLHRDEVNQYQEAEPCEDYILREDSTKLETQKRVEELITKSIPLGFSKVADSESTYCDQSGGCLELTQIMPMSYLHTKAARRATCAHKNLALVWKNIANGQLQKVDRYLYAILRHFQLEYPTLNVFFGVNNELEGFVPGKKESSQRREEGHENNLPVPIPKILFRVVEIQDWFKYKYYRTVVVIHNSLGPIPNEDRVCSKADELEDWNEIENKVFENGLSYACELTVETRKKLGTYYGTTRTESAETATLRLNAFPKRDGVTGDVTNDIKEEYNRLFPGEVLV